jgi:branched-chain amino acid transport system ATP-binding protein
VSITANECDAICGSEEGPTVDALKLDGVSMRFRGLVALREIRMNVPQGERRAVIGPNGAGKSTLFNVIAGDLTPTAGRVFIAGNDVTRVPTFRRVSLGLRRTYQTSALFDPLTVAQNLYLGVLGGDKHGHFDVFQPASTGAILDRVHRAADAVRLSGRLAVPAGDLSHGERRQLEIGLAIANSPRLILLDEPAAGLSADERRLVTELLLALDRRITLMLIEHDMDMALTVGERVSVLHEGEIIAEGSPADVSANALVQKVYLGGA